METIESTECDKIKPMLWISWKVNTGHDIIFIDELFLTYVNRTTYSVTRYYIKDIHDIEFKTNKSDRLMIELRFNDNSIKNVIADNNENTLKLYSELLLVLSSQRKGLVNEQND